MLQYFQANNSYSVKHLQRRSLNVPANIASLAEKEPNHRRSHSDSIGGTKSKTKLQVGQKKSNNNSRSNEKNDTIKLNC